MGIRPALLALASIVLVGCASGQAETASSPQPLDFEGLTASSPVQYMTNAEAVEQMVTLACETGFYNFTDLSGPLSACATFIFAVDAKGGVDPTAFREAMARGDSEAATREVANTWNGLWTSWLAGASLVCDKTTRGPQDATELEITLAALEAVAPRLSRQIYSESQAVFCPSINLPTPTPPSGGLSLQAAQATMCREAVSELPDLIDAGDSAYWTEVVQVLAASEGIAVGPIDGQYGPQTVAGVKELQRRIGVVDDGQVGPITWSALQAYVC